MARVLIGPGVLALLHEPEVLFEVGLESDLDELLSAGLHATLVVVVGVGMVPRGEVGLIFAGTGLSIGVVTAYLYSALVVAVMLTTFAAPPWLKGAQVGRRPLTLAVCKR